MAQLTELFKNIFVPIVEPLRICLFLWLGGGCITLIPEVRRLELGLQMLLGTGAVFMLTWDLGLTEGRWMHQPWSDRESFVLILLFLNLIWLVSAWRFERSARWCFFISLIGSGFILGGGFPVEMTNKGQILFFLPEQIRVVMMTFASAALVLSAGSALSSLLRRNPEGWVWTRYYAQWALPALVTGVCLQIMDHWFLSGVFWSWSLRETLTLSVLVLLLVYLIFRSGRIEYGAQLRFEWIAVMNLIPVLIILRIHWVLV